ncbi:MAG TPA: hypothetical protein VL282_09975 [Tepidisphaeraceae bacterium]|nr:hypothetical protein [Tepidisphaeraceae bacterium]
MLLDRPKIQTVHIDRSAWPPEVELILSAMDAAHDPSTTEHRKRPRMLYRVRGELRLFSDAADSPPWEIYTRDCDDRGLGFITPHRLPLGYGGALEIVNPRGHRATIDCTLFRCREAVPGWFEGALHFNRAQWPFHATK